MIPVVMPDNSMPGLPSAFTSKGTNGGLQIADTEVTIEFEGGVGVKRFLLSFAPSEKVG